MMKQNKNEISVYVSSTGNCYHPKPTIRAKTKITLQEAEDRGFKPSRAYLEYLNKSFQ